MRCIPPRWLSLALSIGCGLAPAWAHEGSEEQFRLVDEALRARPGDAGLWLQRAELHRIHRHWDSAAQDFVRAEQLAPDAPGLAAAWTRMLLDADRLAEAERRIEERLRSHPHDSAILLLVGELFERSARPARAVEAYGRALAAAPAPRPEHYLARARAACATATTGSGERPAIQLALAGIDEGLERLGMIAALELRAIELELELGNHDHALDRLQAIASASPRKEHWLARRAEILMQAGRPHEARAALIECLRAIETLAPRRRAAPMTQQLERDVARRLRQLTDSKKPTPSAEKRR